MLQRAASIHPLVEFLSTCALIYDHRINLVAYCSTCARQNVPEKVTNTAIVLEFRFCLSGENRVLPFPSFFFQVLFHFVLSTGQLVIACTARHLTFSSSCWITKASGKFYSLLGLELDQSLKQKPQKHVTKLCCGFFYFNLSSFHLEHRFNIKNFDL